MTIVKAMRPWLLTVIGMPKEPDDNMRNDDDEADRDLNDHSDKDDDDDDDDAEQVLIGSDDPVCKSCGNFGQRSHRDHKCPNHQTEPPNICLDEAQLLARSCTVIAM